MTREEESIEDQRIAMMEKEIEEAAASLRDLRISCQKAKRDRDHRINQRCNHIHDGTATDEDFFKPEEITFARLEKCSCGSGMARVTNFLEGGCWYCGDLIMGLSEQSPGHRDRIHYETFPRVISEENSEETTRNLTGRLRKQSNAA